MSLSRPINKKDRELKIILLEVASYDENLKKLNIA